MQTLPRSLVRRLRRDLHDSYVVGDLVFSPPEVPGLADFAMRDDSLRVPADPRVVWRTYLLQGRTDPGRTLQLDLALGVTGTAAAFDLMVAVVGSYQRRIPTEGIVVLQDPPVEIGDTGLGWSWHGGPEPEVVAFLRRNVLVAMQGTAGGGLLGPAREIDSTLRGLTHVEDPPANPYYEEITDPEGGPRSVSAGGRIGLVIPPALAGRTPFFSVERGSVNRDLQSPGSWYYRAGLGPGAGVTVDLLTVGAGVLPRGMRIPISVTD